MAGYAEQELIAQLRNSAEQIGMDVVVAPTPQQWNEVLLQLGYVPCTYTWSMIEYQLAYLSSFSDCVLNLALILRHDRRPVGVWPLSLHRQVSGEWRLGSNEAGVLAPLLVPHLSVLAARKLVRQGYSMLAAFEARLGMPLVWHGREEFYGGEGVSEWGGVLLKAGAVSQVEYDLYLDLTLPFADIWSRIRRSYRSLIHTGERIWQVDCLRDPDPTVWEEFRGFHQAVAGRVTRSADSWQKHLDAIAQRAAFLITLRNSDNVMVGAGLFQLSAQEAVYSSGAYDRSLFDKPLGHVVQIAAIREMQARGLRWYRIGARPYPGSQPPPQSKELSIAEYKEGFATHLMPRFIFNRPVSA